MEIRKFEFMAKTQFLCTRIRTIDIDQRKFKQTLCYGHALDVFQTILVLGTVGKEKFPVELKMFPILMCIEAPCIIICLQILNYIYLQF